MRLDAAELTQPPPPSPDSGIRSSTLDLVTDWLGQQPKARPQRVVEAELAETLREPQRGEALWHGLTVLAVPTLWPAALRALWVGEPVWDHMQKQAGWFQVVEALLLQTNTGIVLARAEIPWRRSRSDEPDLETLLRVPLESGHRDASDDAHAPTSPEMQVTVLVGRGCRLAVRVLGHPPEHLRQSLQAICQEADELLEEPLAKTLDKRTLMKPLVEKALLKSGPKAAPWNLATAARSVLVLGAMAAGFITYALVLEQSWLQAVEALDAEPGVKITRVTSHWGRREIEGLRDPQSPDAAEVLRRHGQDLSQVSIKLDTAVLLESSKGGSQMRSR